MPGPLLPNHLHQHSFRAAAVEFALQDPFARAEVVTMVAELRNQAKTHMEVCETLNYLGFRTRASKLWRHPQKTAKLLRSFANNQ